MRLIKPSFEILDTNGYDINGIYKDIERAARVCYKSEDRITEDSAKKMVDSLIKRGHTSCLEHGTVYLKIPVNIDIVGDFLDDVPTWTKCHLIPEERQWAITTNYRRIIENDWLDYLQYLCEPTEYHERRISVRFICSRSISHELVRHRVMSFTMESQRYCNYSKDKHGNEITFIIPSWLDIEEGHITIDSFGCPVKPVQNTYDFLSGLGNSERQYFRLLHTGHTPQEAREVLSNATKTELIVTGFASDWPYFFELRCDKAAHPDMRALTIPLKEEFIDRSYIK